MTKSVGVFGAILLMAACGTPEFRAEQSQCSSEWMSKIPPLLERELYNRSESRQVPTGRTICTTSGNATICDQLMRTEFYTVPAVRTVDRNKPRRDAQISQCTRATCMAKFGNPECKV